MELQNSFSKFLKEIRPTQSTKDDFITGHTTLTDRLNKDEALKPIIVSTFLQGSYRRSTAVRPKSGKKSDVDIIVVTKLSKEEYTNPDDAMDIFVPFLDNWYKDKYQRQGRSFGIELSYVEMDLVITSAPSEAEVDILKSVAVTTDETLEETRNWRLVKSWEPILESNDALYKSLLSEIRKEAEWKTEPLWIPNREAGAWEQTHPLEQIKWTYGKNARCNTHYVNIVKAIKWWQRVNHVDDRLRGYPLEHLIGQNCPDNVNSVAQGVANTLSSITDKYKYYSENKLVPNLPDHGVPSHNVLGRINSTDFNEFYNHVVDATKIAEEALSSEKISESSEKWRKLFGEKFPPSDDDDNKNGAGPFITPSPRSQTGDLTPRKYGKYVDGRFDS
jgi:hypothetical protein